MILLDDPQDDKCKNKMILINSIKELTSISNKVYYENENDEKKQKNTPLEESVENLILI